MIAYLSRRNFGVLESVVLMRPSYPPPARAWAHERPDYGRVGQLSTAAVSASIRDWTAGVRETPR